MRWILWIAITLVVSTVGFSWLVGSELVAPANHPVKTPESATIRKISVQASDHVVAGWFSEADATGPVILLLHGIRSDRSSMLGRAAVLQQYGFSSLSIDLQAHGETPGAHITLGSLESRDVVAAVKWIKARAPNRRIGIVGTSLGGAATLLAPQPLGVDAVVLESVYPRIDLAVANRLRIRIGSLASLMTPLLLWQLEPRLHLKPEDLEPIRHIAQVGAPILVAGGTEDEHTTLRETRSLYVAAAEPKDIWEVHGAKHQDLLAFDPDGYQHHVIQFLIAHLKESASDSAREFSEPRYPAISQRLGAGDRLSSEWTLK